jgi:hypothetical protein
LPADPVGQRTQQDSAEEDPDQGRGPDQAGLQLGRVEISRNAHQGNRNDAQDVTVKDRPSHAGSDELLMKAGEPRFINGDVYVHESFSRAERS